MNLFALSWSYIKTKPLNTGLNIILLSLGIAIITLLLLLSRQVEGALTKNSRGIDLVVGAKGSPMQIILSSVFQIDYPTGNISLKEARQLSRNRLIRNAIPLALGDSYKGYRIVGTNHDYLALHDAEIREGEKWQDQMEAVLGANAARSLDLQTGDTFFGSHGLANDNMHVHGNNTYRVAGILQPQNTAIDNLILTAVESMWAVHETRTESPDTTHAKAGKAPDGRKEDPNQPIATDGLPQGEADAQITSLILQYRSPMAAVQLPRFINDKTNMQAASPAFEIARLFSLIGVGVDMVQGLAYLIIFIAALSIFIALYNALQERQYDLAVMRSLGASKSKLFFHVILEGVTITAIGCLLGLLFGHTAFILLGRFLSQPGQIGISTFTFLPEEIFIVIAAICIGIIAALLPALNAYKTNISQTLAKT